MPAKKTTQEPTAADAAADFAVVPISALDPNDNRELDEELVERAMLSIGQFGQLSPIIVSRDNEILDGGHRYEACRRLGHESIAVVYRDGPKMAIRIQANTVRKDLNFNQRLEAAKWVEENCVRPRGRPKKVDNVDKVDAGEVKKVHLFRARHGMLSLNTASTPATASTMRPKPLRISASTAS
ncbi:MAG: ParB N-terminal domain-containing protein [Chitinispirillales bacterium]|jgi:hypothetical protein|nr:ParB N-terminal domain-containing protein [Chitinispirillales bacterium]